LFEQPFQGCVLVDALPRAVNQKHYWLFSNHTRVQLFDSQRGVCHYSDELIEKLVILFGEL
jgi:hypothetical protein